MDLLARYRNAKRRGWLVRLAVSLFRCRVVFVQCHPAAIEPIPQQHRKIIISHVLWTLANLGTSRVKFALGGG